MRKKSRGRGDKSSSKRRQYRPPVPDLLPLYPDPSTTSATPQENEPDCLQVVKIVLLGAAGVGKSSIVEQFVWNEFREQYSATERKKTYYPTVIINNNLYELKISDIPVISYFPHNSFSEWADYRFYGLRSATAYVLVYDLTNTESFHYIRTMREQMAESRDMRNVPVLVVGNKQDLVQDGVSHVNSAASTVNLMEQGMQKMVTEHAREKRDIVNIVRKHWKCPHIECSAKYNWNVVSVFKELMKAVDVLSGVHGGSLHGRPSSSSKETTTLCSPIGRDFRFGGSSDKCVVS
ncbi:ras-like protein family member 10B [Cloeon dipterum]|uniref:ras-like protein family member 10B n=1 Tax=Cloeon dipterum TaxID=197152 RepID=UPI00322044C9